VPVVPTRRPLFFDGFLGISPALIRPSESEASPVDRPPTAADFNLDYATDPDPWLCQQYRSKVQQQDHSSAMRKVPQRSSCVLNAPSRRARPWFGTKRPQVQILSPRPVPQVADLRECRALRAASYLPALATEASREQKGTRGNSRESRGQLGQAEEHPASTHDVADPAAQQGPSGHCDPPSATKRPFGRDVRAISHGPGLRRSRSRRLDDQRRQHSSPRRQTNTAKFKRHSIVSSHKIWALFTNGTGIAKDCRGSHLYPWKRRKRGVVPPN